MTKKKISTSIGSGNKGISVSIVIPVFNKAEYTERCLKSLRKHTPHGLYEVIVVDNASTDRTAEVLAQWGTEIHVLTNTQNCGFVHACNQGAAAAHGAYLLFLNNDTECKPGWLETMLELAGNDRSIGAVGAKLIYPGGKLQEAGGLIFSDGSGWNFGKGEDPNNPTYNQMYEVDYCSGACLLVRTRLFKRLGGFDIRYAPAYYEDVDLCFGLRQLGYKVVYNPGTEIIHYEGTTAGTQLNTGFKRYQVINKKKFMAKWKDALRGQDESPAVTGRPPITSDRQRLQAIQAAAKHQGSVVKSNHVNILVVDPTLPLFDKQAGSLRLFNILKILRRKGYEVTYIAKEGCQNSLYAKTLEDMGIEVYAGDPEMLAREGRYVALPPIDLEGRLKKKYFHYAWLSFFHIAEQYLPDIRQYSPHTKIFIDTVDVHFVRERRQAELYGDAKLLQAAQATQKREINIYRQADRLITVTEEDRQVLAQEGIPPERISILPIIYDPEVNVPAFAGRQGLVFVANFNHLPNVDAVQYFHKEIYPMVAKGLPQVKCYIVGNNPPAKIKKLAGSNFIVTGYVPNIKPYLNNCRLSIAPLRFGAGMKGKISEALSFGIPVVTTPIGAEGMNLEHGKNVFVCATVKEFAEAIVLLYSDSKLWARISRNGQEHIKQHYTSERVEKKITSLLAINASFQKKELDFYRTLAQHGLNPVETPQIVRDPNAITDLKTKEQLFYVISQSRGYQILSFYYKIRDFLLPMGTRRRKVVKFIFKTLFNYLLKIVPWHARN